MLAYSHPVSTAYNMLQFSVIIQKFFLQDLI